MHSNPTILHSFYNHHVEAFEMIEETVRQGIKATKQSLRECLPCASFLVQSIPSYIDGKILLLGRMYDSNSTWFDYIPLKLKSLN
jgi:hypothetical protein